MPPRVSILIPTYNRASYLTDAIRSAVAQTYQNTEILVLDDASPDHTPEAVAAFADDPRLRYIRHGSNRGIAGNWKAGIQAATGDFFCLLHDDDTVEPDFLERLLPPLLADTGLILSFCDHWVMDAEGQRLAEASHASSRRYKRDALPRGRVTTFARAALVDSSIPVGATLFRRNAVPPSFINENARGSIDAWLCYQCLRTGLGAYYVPERLMNYRVHHGGMSGSMPLYMIEGHLFRYRAIFADAKMAGVHDCIRRGLPGLLRTYGNKLLSQGRHAEARRAFKESLRHSADLRTILSYGLACGGPAGTRLASTLRKGRDVQQA